MVLDVGWNFSGLVVVNVCKCGKDAVVKMHRGCTSCKRFDFHSAYLNGELEEEVFLEQPPNFAFAEPEKFVLKLKKGGRRSNKGSSTTKTFSGKTFARPSLACYWPWRRQTGQSSVLSCWPLSGPTYKFMNSDLLETR